MPTNNHVISYCLLKTARLGELFLVANPTELLGVYFFGHKHAPVIQSNWKRQPNHSVLKNTARQLKEYLASQRTTFDLPLSIRGTPSQRAVWNQIAKIPFGQTITYADLARRAGIPKAIRAAGTATGKNAFSLIIPCHRVIGARNTLGGYAGGLPRKSHLLQIESNPF